MAKFLILNLILSFLFIGCAQKGDPGMFKANQGSLNLVLGKSDCVFAATDSRATIAGENGIIISREDNHQKLFKITDDVVCTIAGYTRSSEMHSSEFLDPASAIINNYIKEINRREYKPSYNEVVTSISYLLQFHLSSIANIEGLPQNQIERNNYLLQIIFIGKNNDKFQSTKMELEIKVNKENGTIYVDSELSAPDNRFYEKIGFETAGWDFLAKEILNSPKAFGDKPEAISCQNLNDLIDQIIIKTGEVNEGVGGPVQIAFFSEKGLAIAAPIFPIPKGVNSDFNLMFGEDFSGVAVRSDKPLLFVSNRFERSGIHLDKHYYSGNHFDNCDIFLNDKLFSFDKNNEISNSKLYLGDKVDTSSEKVKDLMKLFDGKVYLKDIEARSF